jgi:hypothetical protein
LALALPIVETANSAEDDVSFHFPNSCKFLFIAPDSETAQLRRDGKLCRTRLSEI